MPINVGTVTLLALVTALATGLGAAPFVFARSPPRRWLGAATALAAGFMLAASVALLGEGVQRGPIRTAGGVIAGLVVVAIVRRRAGHAEHLRFGSIRGRDARRAFLIVAVMTVHSFAEGVGVGVSFGGGETLGVVITAAIALHNIPEGLAISLVLVPRGASVAAAAGWSVFSSLPQPLLAPLAFLFVEEFSSVLPAGLGFAAGAMVWMVAAELVPEAREDATLPAVLLWGAAAFAAMTAFQVALGLV